MRFVVTLGVCAALALTVAACDSTDKVFFQKGIGTDLNSGDITASTQAQNEYVKNICQQAGLGYDEESVSCIVRRSSDWQVFVQAGMNDIDQRCDAYLQWLDYVRRAKEPTLAVIGDAQTYSTIIMDRAGVGSAPIAIAAAAFGFAKNTFTNVSSRLILEVNHSAVQSVVLSAQKGFREELLGSGDTKLAPVVIASKPAAIYALRSYLRLCMPVTIEAEINNTVVTFARGGPAALADQDSLVSGRNVSVTPPPPATLPTPSKVVITPSARDASYNRLRGLMFPGGKADKETADYVESLLGEPQVGAGMVLNDKTFEPLYPRISNCIVLRNAGKACKAGDLQKFRPKA